MPCQKRAGAIAHARRDALGRELSSTPRALAIAYPSNDAFAPTIVDASGAELTPRRGALPRASAPAQLRSRSPNP